VPFDDDVEVVGTASQKVDSADLLVSFVSTIDVSARNLVHGLVDSCR